MKQIFKYVLIFVITNSVIAQNPLIIPPTISGTQFNLTLQEDSMEFYPGIFTNTMGISFPILGPTLIMEKGDVVTVNFDNQLQDTTTIHWHGMHVPATVDGGPHTTIAPNTIWNPTFTVMDRASTMWYHPHLHHKTYEHVMMGLAGFVIVKDTDEATLNLPRTYGVDDIPVAIQTKVMDANYQIDDNQTNAAMDTLLLVNATREAYFDAPAQVVRFRLLEGSLERSYNIGLSNNANFYVIGSDGGLLDSPVSLNRLLMSPGERYEILIDLTNMQGDTIQIMNYGSGIPNGVYGTDPSNIGGMGGASIPNYANNPLNGADFPLLTLNVGAQTANPITQIPANLVTVNQYNTNNVDSLRTITMSAVNMGPQGALNGPFQLNGVQFDMNVINEVIPLNNTEVWTLQNNSQIAHPFHIHDVQFNILEINGTAPPAHMQGWKDVILVPAMMGSAKFITKFEDFADPVVPYMYHCHIITHEDVGMMGQFIVVDESWTEVKNFEANSISIYPNPTSNTIQIKSNNTINKLEVELIDINGRVLLRESLSETPTTLDVSMLEKGIYLISVNGEHLKFIKN